MNNKTKGAIAAAAGAVILAGGAGTMAAWSDSDSGTDGGTITAGSLSIVQDGDGDWLWANGPKTGQEFDTDDDLLAPGDSVKYVADYTIKVEGTNLTASLSSTLGGIDMTTGLGRYLTVDTNGGEDTDVESGTHTITTTVTFNATGKQGMDESATLSGATVTLTQN